MSVSSQTMPSRSAIVPGTGGSNCASGSDMRRSLVVTVLFDLSVFMQRLYHARARMGNSCFFFLFVARVGWREHSDGLGPRRGGVNRFRVYGGRRQGRLRAALPRDERERRVHARCGMGVSPVFSHYRRDSRHSDRRSRGGRRHAHHQHTLGVSNGDRLNGESRRLLYVSRREYRNRIPHLGEITNNPSRFRSLTWISI